jgi:GNAT superfamily N-acetyltransferase
VSAEALGEYPKTVVLKDGVHLVLRAMTDADRHAVAALLGPPAAAESVIVACDGPRIVGAAALARAAGNAAVLTLALEGAYQRRRLGTWMLLDCVHLATALGFMRLEAPHDRDDELYAAALRRLDFVADPARPAVLVKVLHATWTDF